MYYLIINAITYSVNSIQSKDHRIGTYKIKQNSLLCFDDKYISKTVDVTD